MYISDFKFHKTKTLSEALSKLEKSDNGAPIAGGTDILVEMKRGLRYHNDIVSISEIEELKLIQKDGDNLIVGAGVTHNEIISSPLINKLMPSLAETVSKIGSEQVRNTGTIGGNLCTGASCCDTAPILMALNANLEIKNSNTSKTIFVKDLFIHNRKTILNKGEIVTKVVIPLLAPGMGVHYEKFGLREAASIAVVSVAVMIKLENNICTDACVVIGAVAPTPKISLTSSIILKGKNISELVENSPVLEQAGKAAADDSIPIDDLRASANYRRNILKILTQQAIIKAIDNVNKNPQVT